MALVVFLRGLNVGGYRTFRPSLLAERLKRYHVINIGAAGTILPLHQAGKIRIIGYTGTKRNPQMPDIPTMIESGYPAVVSTTYYGLLGRHDLPADIVNRLNAATAEALKSPELQAGLANILFAPVTMSPGEMAALFIKESERWGAVVKATGFGK